MISRIRRNIIAALPCHCLVLLLLVTSQLPAAAQAASPAVQPAANRLQTPPALSEEVTIRAREQERQGDIYRLNGDVEIACRDYVLRAEHVTYNAASGETEATGGVVLDGGPHDAHIVASRATYNVKTEDGTFYDVVGSFYLAAHGRTAMLISETPFIITGREVRKTGPNRYVVLHGTITSCDAPDPNWSFNAERIEVVPGEDARIYHTSFRLRRIPIIYFPFASHSLRSMGRSSGFVIPTIGQSSVKGFIFGESGYWAINRSMDLTAGAEILSARGWSESMEFRARPTENSSVLLRFFGVQDRVFSSGQDQGGEEVTLNADLNRCGFRSVANVDYLSSFLFRQSFSESYSQAVNSEVASVAFISRRQNGFSFDLMGERYQNFSITAGSSQIKILHAPSFEASAAEHPLFRTPLRWSFDADAAGLSRTEPDFHTATLVGRYDFYPHLALPLVWKGWDIRPEVSVRQTYSSQQIQPAVSPALGTLLDQGLERHAVEGAVEVRPPSLTRVFRDREGNGKFKHVVEPRFVYRYVTGIDHFNNTIRFDERDIFSNTNQLEWGLVERLYRKSTTTKRDPRCDEEAAVRERPYPPGEYVSGTSATPVRCESLGTHTREILSWEVKQLYFFDPTFGGAVIPGQRNVFSATSELTGIAFLTGRRRWSPVVSNLRVLTSENTDVQWQLDYDNVKGQINSSTVLADYRIGEYFIGASNAYLRLPEIQAAPNPGNFPGVFNQFRGLVGYGHPNKRGFSGGASIGYDQHFSYIQYGAVQATYNWDCCGFSMEYRRFALNARNENQYRFVLMLANIGSFGNLRRQERLY